MAYRVKRNKRLWETNVIVIQRPLRYFFSNKGCQLCFLKFSMAFRLVRPTRRLPWGFLIAPYFWMIYIYLVLHIFYWLTNFLTSQVINTIRECFLSSVFCNLISKLMNSPLIKINKNTSRSPIIIVCSLILNIWRNTGCWIFRETLSVRDTYSPIIRFKVK
jgi:hypothetical protein